MSSKREKTDPVDQLLEAAQDEVMLGLSVDTHMSRVSPNYLDPELHRRFLDLRGRPSNSNHPPPPPSSTTQNLRSGGPGDEELNDVLGDDLSARFAALKASLPTASPSSTSVLAASENHVASLAASTPCRVVADDVDDEDDEVEKLIRWAKDAARLDPSPPSDDEDCDSNYRSSDDDNDEDDDSPRRGHDESAYSYLNQASLPTSWGA